MSDYASNTGAPGAPEKSNEPYPTYSSTYNTTYNSTPDMSLSSSAGPSTYGTSYRSGYSGSYSSTPSYSGGPLGSSGFVRRYNPYSLPQITTPKRRKKKQGLFTKDIENLLFALGDRPVSSDATVQCLDDLLAEFLVDLSHELASCARSQRRTRVKMNDLVFAMRNDPLKLARFQYINQQNYRIQRVKKMFEEKTGNFNEENGVAGGMVEDDEDDEEDDEEAKPEETKKKKKKVTGNVMFK